MKRAPLIMLAILAVFSCLFPLFLYFNFLLSPYSIANISESSIIYKHYGIKMTVLANNQSQHVAIILTKQPTHRVLNHLSAFLSVGVDAFVMCDDDPSNFRDLLSIDLVNRILYINDTDLARYDLGANLVWDSVFVWLYDKVNIEYVWLIEDDVTWVHIDDMLDLFNKYIRNRTDLLSRHIMYRNNRTHKWLRWPKSPLNLFPEHMWAGSLNMLVRISRRLIDAHQYYMRQLYILSEQIEIDNNYFYQEFFIATVAHMQNLSMDVYEYSKMNLYLLELSEDVIRDSLAEGERIFHPVKHDSQILANITRSKH